VGAQDPPVVESLLDLRIEGALLHPERDPPARGGVLLRLDGAEPADDVGGAAETGAGDPLISQSRVGDGGDHAAAIIAFQRENGRGTGKRLRRAAYRLLRSLPSARPQDRSQALAAGFQTRVSKPIDPADRVRVLAETAAAD
jgi:hypothetical protein